jgi:peptide/nickel transport system substrate-binding protein
MKFGRRAALGIGASAAGAFVAACAGPPADRDARSTALPPSQRTVVTTGATADEGPPRPGGQLREATVTQAAHFSPFHPSADPAFVNFWRRSFGYYDTLWGFRLVRASDRMALRLATAYEQPDTSTYIVRLRPSTFHNRPPANGRALTAEDVAATVEFLTKPPATGGAFLQSGKDHKSVAALDPLTLRFETHGPRALFFEDGGGARAIVPREMLDEKMLKEAPPLGSGPYQYKSHTLGSIEEMTRFDGYRQPGLPYITDRRLTFMPDTAAIEAAFRAGQLDAIAFTDVKQKDGVARDLGGRIVVHSRPSASGLALLMNVNRPPWNDIRVREAIYRAIDIDRIIATIYFGDAERAWYFSKASYSRAPLGPEPVQQYIGHDPKKATDLLRAAGIDPNREYEFMVPSESQTSIDTGRLIAEDLQRAGLKTRINPVVRNIYLQRAGPKPGDFDLTFSVLLDYNHATSQSGTFWNSASLQDPEVDAIVERIYRTLDTSERDRLSQEFESMLARKYANLLPLISTVEHHAWYREVKGIDPDQHPTWGYQARRWIDR